MSHTTYENLPIVELCDLPKYIGQKVYLKCSYSGVEEYWSLNSIKNKNCDQELLVDLDFVAEYDDMPRKYRRKLDYVHDNYPIANLQIEAFGVFETDQGHYGHLGSNTSRFLVSEIKGMKIVNKQN
ncbi:MAG TPA: hypothetical protein VGB63_05490 [Pedobacter sp.]|jgi:hypothetical protein